MVKGLPGQLLKGLFWLSGIPWAIKVLTARLVKRKQYFWAAVVQCAPSFAGICVYLWLTGPTWATGEKLKITVVVLTLLLLLLKFLSALQTAYNDLKIKALEGELTAAKAEK
jgi:uncharacterized membrane protein (GlpM family)